MATYVLSASDRFPVGTLVSAYAATSALPPLGSPTGSPVTAATVQADGAATFSGLADDTRYYAYAFVSGEHRFVAFHTDEAEEAPDGAADLSFIDMQAEYGTNQAAFTAAYADLTPGGTLYLPTGTYTGRLPTQATKPMRIVGDGPGATIWENIPANYTAWHEGSITDFASRAILTADATPHLQASTSYFPKLSVPTAGYAAGDWILIGSDEAIPNGTEGGTKGEIAKVREIDSAGLMTLWSPLHDTYTIAQNAWIQKITFLTGITIEGITFSNSAPNTGPLGFLYFERCRRLTIRDCEFANCDQRAISLKNCIDWDVDNCHFRDFEDRNTSPLLLGYGVVPINASMFGRMTNCTGDRLRHLFTTNVVADAGEPRHIDVAHCQSYNATNAHFDTHTEGQHIAFRNCTADGGTEYNDTDEGSGSGYGFQIRCNDAVIENCQAVNTRVAGLYYRDWATGLRVKGFRAVNTRWTSYSSAQGIRLEGSNAKLSDVLVDGCDDHGIRVSGTNNEVEIEVRRAGLNGGTTPSSTGALQFTGGSGHKVRLRAEDCVAAVLADTGSPTSCEVRVESLRNAPVGTDTWVKDSAGYGVTPVARAAAIASPTADAASLKTAVDAIRTALTNYGITS